MPTIEEQALLMTLAEAISDLVAITAADGRPIYINTAGRRLLGLTPGSGLTNLLEILLAELPADEREMAIRTALSEGRWEKQTRVKGASGQPIPVTLTLISQRRARGPTMFGEVLCYVAIARDNRERLELEEALGLSEAQFASILSIAPDAVISVNEYHRIVMFNRAASEVFGYTLEEVVGEPLEILMPTGVGVHHRHHVEGFIRGPHAARLMGDRRDTPIQARRKDGTLFPAEISISRVPVGNRTFCIAILRDITERVRVQEALRELAERDPLTGLLNRRRFLADLERHLLEARRTGIAGAVLFVDLDNFKEINDSLGHQAGDRLLVSVTEVIQQRLRGGDLFARLGGDEFAILLPSIDRVGAEMVATRLLDGLRHHTIAYQQQKIGVTSSLGLALYPAHGEDTETLLAVADRAMYHAKAAGRNQISTYKGFDAVAETRVEVRLNWETRLRLALERNEFVLLAQPIRDLQTGEICSRELLIRLPDDSGGLIPPSAFLGVAEQFGLISAIDRWVIRRAMRQISSEQRAGRPCVYSVNLSARATGDRDLAALIHIELTTTGIDPALLQFEITETSAISDLEQARHLVQQLQLLGCRFALDDFGTGFSSFQQIKHLPVDTLKIDGSFIRNLVHDPVDQHLVRSIVGLARGLQMRTVAEGVEDEATLQLVRQFGISSAQGYHIGQPARCPEITEVEKAG